MRYMGDPLSDAVTAANAGPLDATIKANLLVQAATMPDARARDFVELTDATPYGTRTKFLRIGLGAAGGLLLGFVLGRKKRKR